MRAIKIASALIFLLFSSTWAYLEPSFRIKALGEDFVGIIVDEYTDIFRNPAYLALVQNYKVLGEYRKDGSNRLLAGTVLPASNYAKIALLGKGWQQKREETFQSGNIYSSGGITQLSERNSENISDVRLTNSGLIYAMDLGQHLLLGANLTYFEDKLKSDNQSFQSNLTYDDSSGILREKSINEYGGHSLNSNQSLQISAGAKFLLQPGFKFDVILSFKHLDLENVSSAYSFSSREQYDSAGNLTQTANQLATSDYATPDQKGNSFGIGLRISKNLATLEAINLLIGFSFTDWDKTTRRVYELFRNDTLMSSILQLFGRGQQNMDMQLKIGIESKSIGRAKLYAGVANFWGLEKLAYPSSLLGRPDSKFRTGLYKISMPLGIEYSPLNNVTIRYGALPNYVYSRTESIDPYSNSSLNVSIRKTTSFNNSIGYSFTVIKRLTFEGYLLQLGNITNLNDWIFGASYTF